MNDYKSEFVTAAQKAKQSTAFITAGGGAELFGLFKIKGCSRTLSEARMLYSPESFASFLGKPLNGKYVSQETADLLAKVLANYSNASICFALTCALSTDRERKGDNHGYLSICTEKTIVIREHIRILGDTRFDQDSYVTDTVLKHLIDYIKKQ